MYGKLWIFLGLHIGNAVGTTGAVTPPRTEEGTSHLGHECHCLYHRVVGKPLWLVLIRPSTKLSRTLQHTDDDYFKLKHTLQLPKGNARL